jgi:hypothetical protein
MKYWKMNRRLTLLLVVVGLALAGGLVFLFWPKQSDRPLVRLKIVRRAVEQGKPVVFFRVETADSRRIQIAMVAKIIGDQRTGSVEYAVSGPLSKPKPAMNFWAPSQASPIMSLRSRRSEFGIVVPTNASIWRVQVTVFLDLPIWDRLRAMPSTWSYMRKSGTPFPKAERAARNAFYYTHPQELYSDPITNAVTPEASTPVRPEALGK